MNRILVRLAAFAGAGLLAMAGPAGARADEPVKLEAKFPEGQTLRYRFRTSIHQLVKNLGMEMPSNLDRTVDCSAAIGPRRGDSSLPIAVKVESLRDRLRLPGGLDVSYDSKDQAAKVANPDLDFFNDLYRTAGQVAYTVVLDGKNKVKAIEGADTLRQRLDRLDPRAGDLLRSRLSAGTLRADFEQALGALPDGPIKPGQTWERTEAVDCGAGLKIVLKKKYAYAGTEKKGGKTLDKITAKVTDARCAQDADSSAPIKVVKSDMKIDSSEVTVLFDREAGRIVESHERLEMKGNVTVSDHDQEQSCGFELTMRIDAQLQPGGK
jgi:hypothetical protein